MNTALIGKVHEESRHPISRNLVRIYEPVAAWVLRWKWTVIGSATALVLITIPVFMKLGSEFMPPLNEGSLLHAHDHARHIDCRGAESPAGH